MATKAGKTKTEEVIEQEVMEKPAKIAEGFTLPNEIVKLQFVKRQKGNITNPDHIAYGGMIEGAYKEFVPKRSAQTFKYIPILTKEEQEYLEGVLGLEKHGLNMYKEVNNFWDSVKFSIPKEGKNLHLNDPMDYIYYKMLLTYENTVAKSLHELKTLNKLSYSFVMIRDEEQENAEVEKYNVKKEAYNIASKLESSITGMREFLYLYGIRVSPDTSFSWMVGRMGKMVEEEPQKIIDIYTSKDYKTRSLIAKGVLAGVIRDQNGAYYLEDGVGLCGPDETPSLSNAIRFLTNPGNANVRNRLEAKLG